MKNLRTSLFLFHSQLHLNLTQDGLWLLYLKYIYTFNPWNYQVWWEKYYFPTVRDFVLKSCFCSRGLFLEEIKEIMKKLQAVSYKAVSVRVKLFFLLPSWTFRQNVTFLHLWMSCCWHLRDSGTNLRNAEYV